MYRGKMIWEDRTEDSAGAVWRNLDGQDEISGQD